MDRDAVARGSDTQRFWWRGADAVSQPEVLAPLAPEIEPTLPRDWPAACDEVPANPGVLSAAVAARPVAPAVSVRPPEPAGRRSRAVGPAARHIDRPAVILAGAAGIGIAAFLLFSGGGRSVNPAVPLGEQLDQIAIALGLGIDEIRLTGHRHAIDNDIFAALGLDAPRSILGFSPEAARRRIEALAWIERASVTRILPAAIEVRVRERKPAALWLQGEQATLVDRSGAALSRVGVNTAPDLPRLAGDGAGEAAAEILAELERHPMLTLELAEARRIGGRRWSLVMRSGAVIDLPGDGAGAALDRFVRTGREGRALVAAGSRIDLRHPGQIVVGRGAPAGGAGKGRPSLSGEPASHPPRLL